MKRSLAILHLLIVLSLSIGIGVYNNLCDSCDDGISFTAHQCELELMTEANHNCCSATDLPEDNKEECPSEFKLISFDVLSYENTAFDFIKVKVLKGGSFIHFNFNEMNISAHFQRYLQTENNRLKRFELHILPSLFSKSSLSIIYQQLKLAIA